jgi:transposase
VDLVLLARALLDQLAPARELVAKRRRLSVGGPDLRQKAAGQQLRQRPRIDLVGLGPPAVLAPHRLRVGQCHPPNMRAQDLRDRLRHLDFLDAEVAAFGSLGGRALASGEMRRLMQLPGVSATTAATFMAAVGDISRFPTPRHLVGYLRRELDEVPRPSSRSASTAAAHATCRRGLLFYRLIEGALATEPHPYATLLPQRPRRSSHGVRPPARLLPAWPWNRWSEADSPAREFPRL